MQIFKGLENKIFPLLLTAFFLFRLPPFNLLPGKDISLINSQSVARYILIFILLFLMYKLYRKKLKIDIEIRIAILTLFYFITQSLSVINAISISAFLEIYKHIAFGVLFFFLTLVLLDSKEKIKMAIKILFLTIIANLIYQSIIYFNQGFLPQFQGIFYGKYWEVFSLNMNRGRLFVDIYDSALIPVIFAFFLGLENNMKNNFYKSLLIILTMFFAAISGFRTHLLMVFSSILGTIYVYSRNINTFLIKFLGFLFIAFILLSSLQNFIGSTSIERVVDPSEGETQTIALRFDWWKQSIEMGLSSPLLGIGLNNFYDYVSPKTTINMIYFGSRNRLPQITATHPHSIFFQTFAETGILGFISLLSLLIFFIIIDFKAFRGNNILTNLLIVSFWSLFLFSVFNPPVTLQYIILFWFLRALILKCRKYYY